MAFPENIQDFVFKNNYIGTYNYLKLFFFAIALLILLKNWTVLYVKLKMKVFFDYVYI